MNSRTPSFRNEPWNAPASDRDPTKPQPKSFKRQGHAAAYYTSLGILKFSQAFPCLVTLPRWFFHHTHRRFLDLLAAAQPIHLEALLQRHHIDTKSSLRSLLHSRLP